MKNNQDYLSIGEAMQTLSISKPTLYRWIKAGKLKAVRHINRTFITSESANELNRITPLN